MNQKFLLSVLCTLLLAQFSVSQHEVPANPHAGESTGETMTTSKSPCAIPLDDLHGVIEEIFGANYTVYINCLSFNAKGYLRRGIASGQSPTGPVRRYEVECRGDVIVALELSTVDMPLDMTDMRDTTCLECVDGATACIEPCAPACERCYETTTKCSRCRACTSLESELCRYEEGRTLECAVDCPESSVPGPPHYTINHEEYNYCQCIGAKNLLTYPTSPPSSGEEEEEEIHCPDEEEEKPYTCDAACTTLGHDINNETGICFACGLEYCVRCERDTLRCTQCLAETVLFEHECFACPRAPIALAALEQEREVEEEEHDKELRTIELAVSLPILCVLIIVFFVSMSAFAHHRYPHVSQHGQKRHRKPPTHERSLSPSEVQEMDQLQESHVWRPRPTIVLR